MADAQKTPSQLLATILGDHTAGPQGSDGMISRQAVRNLIQAHHIDVLGKLGSRCIGGGQTSDGGNLAVDLYDVDMTALKVMVGGVPAFVAALDDVVMIGAGASLVSYALDGTAAVVLTADGKCCECAIVAILVNGDVELRAVFSDEEDGTTPTAPTSAEIKAALAAAAIADHDATSGVIVARIKIIREATNTMTLTHRNIDTYEALAEERMVGTLYTLTA